MLPLADRTLADILAQAVSRRPDHPAVEEPPGHSLTYRELDLLSDQVAGWLVSRGVKPGDRVGIYLPKSIDSLAAIYGSLKAGAAYVPVDAAAPSWRAAYILHDCAVAMAVLERALLPAFEQEAALLGRVPPTMVLDAVGGGLALRDAVGGEPQRRFPAPPISPDDLAFILYTSGSTGKPKGVMHSHRNAAAFITWCAETFAPTPDDRFSSHAPFHFDLSVLDLYLAAHCTGTVVLISAEAGKEPAGLAALIAERRLTVWYSTPSILSLLVQYGKLQRHDLTTLRLILFAGEVFPVKHLRSLTRQIPQPRYFNLYGPTETNVCTFHEIPVPIPDDRTTPYPIGTVCSNYTGLVADDAGNAVERGSEGELCIRGTGVMLGYWNLPELLDRSFRTQGSDRWYRTGDVVTESDERVLSYVGRRDRMVKRRGYRIELGDIESGLYRHPAVREVAVIALPSEETGVRITAFVSCPDEPVPSVIELKRFSAETLPQAMIPDAFVFRNSLPKTSTGKVDYQALAGTH
jgi:amino acid adenylation domain-containing protein